MTLSRCGTQRSHHDNLTARDNLDIEIDIELDHAEETPMSTHRQTATITYETAARAVALALEIGAERGLPVVAAVADPSMTLIAYGMADDSTPHSAETSQRKAKSSASIRRRTGQIAGALAATLPLATAGTMTTIDGGVPIFFGELHVGGLGVAGGPPALDAEIALETLKRLGARTEGMEL